MERTNHDKTWKNERDNGRDWQRDSGCSYEKKGKTQEKMERGSRMNKRANDTLVRPPRENGGG